MEQWKRTVLPLLTLFTALMVDGIFSAVFRPYFVTEYGLIVPRFTLLLFIVLGFYLKPGHLTVLALLFGFFFDSYYTGYLAIYMASFAIIAYLIIKIRHFLQGTIINYVLVSIIMVTVLEVLVFSVYRVLGISDYTIQVFLVERLGITLVFNTLAMLILAYPFNKFVQFIVHTEEKRFKNNFKFD